MTLSKSCKRVLDCPAKKPSRDTSNRLPRGSVALRKYRNWALAALGLTLCILFYAFTMFPQDRIFSEYKQAFAALPHPQGTKFVATYNAFGALDKIRVMYSEDFPQGCDYRVAQIREYSGSPADIEAFYAAQTILIGGESQSPWVLFIPMNAEGTVDPYELPGEQLSAQGPGAFDLLENIKYDQKILRLKAPALYYYVAISGFSYSDDIRCQF
jgi:hypothetical protein